MSPRCDKSCEQDEQETGKRYRGLHIPPEAIVSSRRLSNSQDLLWLGLVLFSL